MMHLCLTVASAAGAQAIEHQVFQAGAAVVDITPPDIGTDNPSIIAGSFLEGTATSIQSPLYVRTLVLDDGITRMVLSVVDTCMMTQSLIDQAKSMASQQCGIPVERMMVSATHTHSAPAAMSCLGTRQDKKYAAWLPGKIAESILAAQQNLEPARIGWASVDDWQHTHNRRWIRKPESKIVDPFGNATGLAHMHPGYQSPDVIGPSGPVDPALSVIALQTLDERPLAVFANYSQHYFGSPAVSSDYFGLFCKHMATILRQPGEGNGPFVAAISQGTSGDLMWMDYGSSANNSTLVGYAEQVARYAEKALAQVEYRDFAELKFVEKNLSLNYRVPDQTRLDWARAIAAEMGDRLPKTLPEVYAREAIFLHDMQKTQLKLQAIRIGDLTIATLPNEVYALTGLKLRGRSPAAMHFNIELANGAEGYIPTPEQHQLGGYTTWPARTAGLEVQAEPKIVDALTGALEEATGLPRRVIQDQHGPYAEAILESKPIHYWRLNDEDGNAPRNAVPSGHPAHLTPGFAWFLPGAGSGTGIGSREALTYSEFSGPEQINRAVHLAGGTMRCSTVGLSSDYSLNLWFWLGERSGASQREGILIQGPSEESLIVVQNAQHEVTLKLLDQTSQWQGCADQWNFVTLVRHQNQVRVFVNGLPAPVLEAPSAACPLADTIILGEGLQGKIDEVAVFDSVLSRDRIQQLWNVSQMQLEHESSIVSSVCATEMDPAGTTTSQPITPQESIAGIHVPLGYRVDLAACEPQVLDPVAFDWDAAGRLWVVEMADYPLGMDGQGKSGGRVRMLEDNDGDGQFETSHLFADNLNFPTGILTWRDGVLVTAAPKLLFLRDTNGDGRADVREVLFEGFNEGNQQLRMNGLRWGMDNWVYCASGGHHAAHGLGVQVRSLRNGRTYELGSRDFRFKPDTGELQVESGPSQFGRNRNEWGHWFGTQNASPLWHYVLPDRYLARNPYVPTVSPIHHVVPTGSPPVYPASPLEKRYHSYEQSGRYTSACGSTIYGDNLLFPLIRSAATINQWPPKGHCFTCEPFHNLVQHNWMLDEGVSYTAVRPDNEGSLDFFASQDRWCRPVMVRTGPDGGLWVADMYRYMIEHPDWLPPEGRAELLPHYRLGDDRGRIYRVMPSIQPHSPVPKLASASTRELIDHLASSNVWVRDKAHQMLLWQKAPQTAELLERAYLDNSSPTHRIHIINLLDGLSALSDPILLSALNDSHPRVRENAIRLAENSSNAQVIASACKLSKDEDAKVCLQLGLSAGQWPDPVAGEALVELARRFPANPLMVSAIMSSALMHENLLAHGIFVSQDIEVQAVFREPLLRQSIGRANWSTIATVFDSLFALPESVQSLATYELLQTLRSIGADVDQLLQEDSSKSLAATAARLELLWNRCASRVVDRDTDIDMRLSAAKLLLHSPSRRPTAITVLAEFLSPQIDPYYQSQALSALSQSAAEQVPEVLGDAWSQLSPDLRSQAMDVWLSREAWTNDLLDRLEAHQFTHSDLSLTQRSHLLQYPVSSVVQRAQQVLLQASSPSRAAVIDKYRPALQLAGDRTNGRQVYLRACANCHRHDSDGYEVGPNLATVVSHAPEKLLVSILDPSFDIQPGFQAITCLLESGEILTGLLTSETASSVTIKQSNGLVRSITRREIEQLTTANKSFMPEGLEESLSLQELADLIAFLRQP